MPIAAAEVLVPVAGTSIELSPGAVGESVWLRATTDAAIVYIGPSGVTPATGLPLPRCELVGPIALGLNALHGVIGAGQDVGAGVAVRVLRTS